MSRPDPFRLTSTKLGLERLLGLHHIKHIYDRRPAGCDGFELIDWALRDLNIRIDLPEADASRIPADGPALIVANHPYGGIEGMALASLLRRQRPDTRVMANYVLGRVPELREPFILVDPFERQSSVRTNLSSMRQALGWLREGGVLAVFPAGEVAHRTLLRSRVDDPPWNPAVVGLARRVGCPVVPVYFDGHNRLRFQLAGLLHPALRTAMLPREMMAIRGRTLDVRVGSAVPWRQLESQGSAQAAIEYLRARTFILSRRSPEAPRAGPPIQPRVTPSGATPVVAPCAPDELAREIAGLTPDQRLVDAGEQEVWIAEAAQIPTVLREIGRLRELAFREVGEGTGREIDLDQFDASYRHLFIWNRRYHEIVGAYRLGLVDRLTEAGGSSALYTSTLFRYRRALFESMGPAIEMGRSFIRPEHQKSYAGLMMLWKGIGEFVQRHPRYATLFGPVSISAEYQSASQRLIVAFLEQNRFAHPWSRWVHAQTPARARRSGGFRPHPSQLRDLDDVSTFISEIEADQKGVPILLKQYLRLGGRLLGFNVDPQFSHVLDVLLMVDLRQTQRRILTRYMGRKGAGAFLDYHARLEPRAG